MPSISYLDILAEYYPAAHISCPTDSTQYSQLTWYTLPIAQSELDEKELDLSKLRKKEKIDNRTKELILGGFLWNGVSFSTSENAQRNWLALRMMSSLVQYPKRISTKDGNFYDLADETELLNFVAYGFGVLESRYAGGVILRDQVNTATDVAGVDAVEDLR